MNEILLIAFLVLAVIPTPYDLYLAYKADFKISGFNFISEVSNVLTGDMSDNRWSFDQRYIVEAIWNGIPLKVTLGVRNLEIVFHSDELPKTNLFLVQYPKYRNEIFHVERKLHRYVPAAQIWKKSYTSVELQHDLINMLEVFQQIKAGKPLIK